MVSPQIKVTFVHLTNTNDESNTLDALGSVSVGACPEGPELEA